MSKRALFGLGFITGGTFASLGTLMIFEWRLDKENNTLQTDPNDLVSKVNEKNYFANDVYEHLGLPIEVDSYQTRSYISGFSPRLRTPEWVFEYFCSNETAERLSEGKRSNSKFFEERSIPLNFRSTNADYAWGSELGLSRGHLAAAQFHKESQSAIDDTFNLSFNIVPQQMTMNGCDWFRLEQMVKRMSKIYNETWVITGPAFVPTKGKHPGVWEMTYSLVGERRVAVPTHLYKIILGKSSEGEYHMASFLMPNEPLPVEYPLNALSSPS